MATPFTVVAARRFLLNESSGVVVALAGQGASTGAGAFDAVELTKGLGGAAAAVAAGTPGVQLGNAVRGPNTQLTGLYRPGRANRFVTLVGDQTNATVALAGAQLQAQAGTLAGDLFAGIGRTVYVDELLGVEITRARLLVLRDPAAPPQSVPLVGRAATLSRGSLGVTFTRGLTAPALAAATGVVSVSPDSNVGLAGLQAAAAAGTAAPDVSSAVTGAAGTSAAGTLLIVPENALELTGAETAAPETAVVRATVSAALVGQGVSAQGGAAEADGSRALVGQAAGAAAGALAGTGLSTALQTQFAQVRAGALGQVVSPFVALTGSQATATPGTATAVVFVVSVYGSVFDIFVPQEARGIVVPREQSNVLVLADTYTTSVPQDD